MANPITVSEHDMRIITGGAVCWLRTGGTTELANSLERLADAMIAAKKVGGNIIIESDGEHVQFDTILDIVCPKMEDF